MAPSQSCDPFAEYALADPFIPSAFAWQPGMLVAGVDEVGRGPLVGAVVTAVSYTHLTLPTILLV